jgi:hypothetical protein
VGKANWSQPPNSALQQTSLSVAAARLPRARWLLNADTLGGQMSWWVGVAILGVALALWNARVTVRVWRSGVYERGQLVAQTAIIWLVPGSAIVVAAVLKGGAPHRADDPTAPNPDTPNATITTGASGVGAP